MDKPDKLLKHIEDIFRRIDECSLMIEKTTRLLFWDTNDSDQCSRIATLAYLNKERIVSPIEPSDGYYPHYLMCSLARAFEQQNELLSIDWWVVHDDGKEFFGIVDLGNETLVSGMDFCTRDFDYLSRVYKLRVQITIVSNHRIMCEWEGIGDAEFQFRVEPRTNCGEIYRRIEQLINELIIVKKRELTISMEDWLYGKASMHETDLKLKI